MDRRNLLSIIITVLLLITCTSKDQSVQATEEVPTYDVNEGWELIGKDGFNYLYRKEYDTYIIIWAVPSHVQASAFVTVYKK